MVNKPIACYFIHVFVSNSYGMLSSIAVFYLKLTLNERRRARQGLKILNRNMWVFRNCNHQNRGLNI